MDWKEKVISIIKQISIIHYDRKYMRKTFKVNPTMNEKMPGEKEWKKKWKKIDPFVTIARYRQMAHFCGPDINIISSDTIKSIIEPSLNLDKYNDGILGDKNLFEKVIDSDFLPKSYLRYIAGFFYDVDYKRITNIDIQKLLHRDKKYILKPSTGTGSGIGVKLLKWDDESLIDNDSKVVDNNYLCSIKRDYIIQECMEQSSYISQFCKSSVNTIRLATYRSVKDDEVKYLAAILRIGRDGSFLDNAHQGGMFVGLKPDGRFEDFLCDQYGRTKTVFNGVEYKDNNFQIPNYDKVVQFAKDISKFFFYVRLVAFDIMLDKNNNPKIIEFNVNWFGEWLFQLACKKPIFGEYTDEIYNYCLEHKYK